MLTSALRTAIISIYKLVRYARMVTPGDDIVRLQVIAEEVNKLYQEYKEKLQVS